jgi:site-specific DNA-methyltransferase (adenine-specific)
LTDLAASRALLWHDDASIALDRLPEATFDALITDPPYCSGTAKEKSQLPEEKYSQDDLLRGRPSFAGDNKSERAFVSWCATWLRQCRRAVKPGGYALVAIDWRNLPALTDAIQHADWIWRGIIAWDKGNAARAPHKGFFRHQMEFFVWATNGDCARRTDSGPFPGVYQHSVAHYSRNDKHHLTGKPTALMRDLMAVVPVGGFVLDPFAGSGTTAVAAIETGRHALCIEREGPYIEIAQRRINEALTAQ